MNVNIITERFDDPKEQTVFLALPTKTTIMMMQMVGRALRGPKVGGTKEAYIVSFIDDWKERIRWSSPKELIAREEVEFADTPQARRESVRKLILIKIIEDYATFLDGRLGSDVFGGVPFVQRIPVGVYAVAMLDETTDVRPNDHTNGGFIEQTTDILIFEGAESAFQRMMKEVKPSAVPAPGTKSFEQFVERTMKRYFEDLAGLPYAPRADEIRVLLGHMAEFGTKPVLHRFEQRDDCDVTKLATEIIARDMGPQTKMELLQSKWNSDASIWRELYEEDFERFERAVSEKVSDLSIPQELRPLDSPKRSHGQKRTEDCSMSELFAKRPDEWMRIRKEIYQAAYDKRSGEFQCAETGWRSARKLDFQIDHIYPSSLLKKSRG